ncbi:hypothetical protein GJAV_G00082450 [Gymnothorax javanicus]|nr:hypothetical protein GJAV_G00082450 [Gymnothorax javanicus]
MEYCFGKQRLCGIRILNSLALITLLHFASWKSVSGWSYHYSDTTMNWQSARQWCRDHYTDMVAIQNQGEIAHLNEYLPRKSSYYWIGIRKIKGVWTWVGTQKTLTEEAENWARGEPNNGKNNEDCVEIYIKREKDTGKWNDESCWKKKTALCYTASCQDNSCSGHGECVETINSHECRCHEGFFGEKCEHVVTCEAMDHPRLESCFHPFGTFSYNSTCQFSCEDGYELSDTNPILCAASGNWSAEPPLCEAVQCNELISPVNGHMDCVHTLGNFSYMSSCTFSCADGYKLVGSTSNKLTCGSTGQWNDQQPRCEAVRCPSLSAPQEGSMSCSASLSDEMSYGSTCNFSCAAGFRLQGPPSITCTASAQWSQETPSCEAIKCQSPEKRAHMSVECSSSADSLRVNSTCSFSCDEGFILTGAQSVRCSEAGEWSDQTPVCTAVKCPSLDEPTGGSILCSSDDMSYDNSCSFSCNEGFILTGAESVRCSETGEWSDQTPVCTAVKCPLLDEPTGGSILCSSDEMIYGDTCSFSCNEGFILTGAESVRCSETGEWSDQTPVCTAVKCPLLDEPTGGSILCSSDEMIYGDTCSFSCNEGFILTGAESVRCSETGEWSDQTPICTAVTCPSLEKPIGGHMVCSDSSNVSRHANIYGTNCSFTCGDGFDLEGSETLTCNIYGNWTEEVPVCQARPKSLLGPASFGVAAGGTIGLSSLSMLMLFLKRRWQRAKHFELNSSMDEEIPPQQKHQILAKMLLKGHCCSQKCYFGLLIYLLALGHDLSSDTGVKAWTYHYSISPYRNWNSARDWCRQHYTDMVAIQNQREIMHLNEFLPKDKYWIGIRKVSGVWTWIGTNKTLTKEAENWAKGEPNNRGKREKEDCVEIYIKRDTEAGKWNDQSCKHKKGTLCFHASCRKDSCSTHAECVETIGNYTCKCFPGFQGQRCEKAVECGVLKAPKHGLLQCSHTQGSFRFNSSCTFHCLPEFTLMGPSHLQCQASASWDSAPPSCQAVKCPELTDAPTFGNMSCYHPIEPNSFNSTCKFSCGEGFELKGPSSIRCNSSGSWSNSMPICRVKRCNTLTAPLHGSLHCLHPHEEFSFNSSCNVSCEEGFLLNGTASIQCTSSGVWSEPLPLCHAQQCLPLVAPDRAQMNCSHPHSHFSFGSSCELGCEEGFVLRGAPSLQCTESGLWSHTAPSCRAQKCKVLTAPLHGSLHCLHPHEEFSFNSSCNVSCEEGFLLNGTASIQCTSSGVWTEPLPLCQAQQCLPLVAPDRAQMNCSHPHSHFSFGSSCELGCEEGFVLRGAPSLQCTESGLWSHTAPSCRVKQCNTLTAPLHGSLHCLHPHEEFSFNSSCNVSCEEGFLLNGTASIQCTSSGVWTEPPPLCQVKQCKVLTAPLHGSLHCLHPHEEFSFNSSCNVSCEEGFLLNGTTSIRCTSSGVWSEPLPLCQAQQCLPLVAPDRAQMNCSHPHSHFSFGSSCEMGCEEGFVLRGAPSLQCTESGLWSHTAPSCRVKQCKVLTAPLHGSLHCLHPHEEFSFNSSCNVSCEEGFLLNGTDFIRCTSSGVWSEPLPLCQAQQCLPLVAPDRAQMNCSHPHSHFSFGSSCEMGCEEGFVLRGAPSLQCTESGLWSHTAPSCRVKQCKVLTAPLHGSLHCLHPHEEFSFNSSCNVSCEEGFLLNGTDFIRCTSSGVWSEPLPLCQAQQCLPLVAPDRAQMNCSHPHSHFSFGSSCEMGCEEGFVLRGAPSLQCAESGLWSHTAPFCRVKQCNTLTAPLHGSLHCLHPHEEFSFNSSCNVSCEEGFLLNGTASIQCTSSGVWTEPPPLCQAVQCPALGERPSPFLSMKCRNPLRIFSFRSQCFFHCGNGSSLNGTSSLSCTSNGTWNAPQPSCIEPEMTVGTGMLISVGVGFASAISLLLLGGLVFVIASRLSRRAQKHYQVARNFAIWEEHENPAFYEGKPQAAGRLCSDLTLASYRASISAVPFQSQAAAPHITGLGLGYRRHKAQVRGCLSDCDRPRVPPRSQVTAQNAT